MKSRQDGFTIIEVVMAMMLLAIVLTSLAGFTFSTARAAVATGDATSRQAASLELVNRLNAMPADSLGVLLATPYVDTFDLGVRNRFERRATLTGNGQVNQVVVQTRAMQRDTTPLVVRFMRQPPGANGSPLCVSGAC
jgi:prepilin-type N-terminal cleavage/methylation domain-containing protein